ncbi:MAG: sigma-E factor negative regulatory protein [Rubrivivax sp.]|nr:sigma-E factor negative regulatory protein [Rubrivivax sp.]
MNAKPANELLQTSADDTRAWLSALADGEAQAVDRACAGWREDAEARKTWHAYQLIGDVMRSDDLARPAARDADFLAGVRERLAAEPVVLAPAPAAEPAPAGRRRQHWLLPVAAAAGFVVVAGVLVVARVSQPGAEAPVGVATTADPAALVLVRDERLDEFLRAHQSARGGVAVAAPGGALRRVELTVPATPAR